MSEAPKDGFEAYRQDFVRRILCDYELSHAAARVGSFMAVEYLNREVRDMWPGYPTLAKRLGLRKSHIIRAVNELLAREHLIRRHKGAGRGDQNVFEPGPGKGTNKGPFTENPVQKKGPKIDRKGPKIEMKRVPSPAKFPNDFLGVTLGTPDLTPDRTPEEIAQAGLKIDLEGEKEASRAVARATEEGSQNPDLPPSRDPLVSRLEERLLPAAWALPDRPTRLPRRYRRDDPNNGAARAGRLGKVRHKYRNDDVDVTEWSAPNLDEVHIGDCADIVIRQVAA
jgi:hypothetical protein